ncbi:helix-turn-helix domain-containing protein [Meiothermus sp. CFH 77666]|uniref:helix-turn-helix domain-containing protein n=1 Tax=Meiothermus sp. CFH 77666 TaxID=2817942 RepID=UPI001AA074CA|nr:helix-turn-helix domain-containing protein [Meiothermus sp. CFH 77666]MBO1436305.1 helix-turn-helix domain-containing protein [Meiothermus sp. CFH 77666]
MNDEVLTLEETAHFLKVSDATVYQLARSGALPARKVGREWRFVRSRLMAWLEQGGEEMEGKVIRDEFGGEYMVENGQEKVALWLPMSREEKRRLLEKAAQEGWSFSEKVMALARELMADKPA